MGKGIEPAPPLKLARIDATTGPTDWAGRSIELERKMGMEDRAPAPPEDGRRPGRSGAGATADATDAVTGATSRVPGSVARPDGVDATSGATPDATTGATSRAPAHSPGSTPVDAATGATPGVAAACRDLGMSALDDVVDEYGILPPGQA